MNTQHTHFPVLSGPPNPIFVTFPPQKKKKQANKEVQFVLPVYPLEHG